MLGELERPRHCPAGAWVRSLISRGPHVLKIINIFLEAGEQWEQEGSSFLLMCVQAHMFVCVCMHVHVSVRVCACTCVYVWD